MTGKWRELTFSEAVFINPPVRLERGCHYPFVDMSAVSPEFRCAYANEEREFSGSGSRFQHGDVLMARITPCLENGKIARFCASESSQVAHGSTEFIVIRGRPSVTHTDFAYYLTLWEEVRGYAISHMTGTSGRQRVPTDSFDHLTVPIPPLPEQRAIAHILGTLDDKIELNRRLSETLEQMARALFKAWFVDFEPVRAKMEGRWRRGESLPGLPAHLYDLFPDRLVDSELGEIPEGWRVGTVDEEFDLTMGQSPPGDTYNEIGDGVPFYQGSSDFGFRFPTRRMYCTVPTRLAKAGDTLVSVRAPVGDINIP
jgi:type I restriction enzyme S subunit